MLRSGLALLVLAASLALVACRRDTPPPPEKAVEPAAPELAYEEVLTGGARADEPLPLIVMIHGLGDRPESLARIFEVLEVKARVVLPRGPGRAGSGFSWFTVVPEEGARSANATELARSAVRIARLIAGLTKRHPTLGAPIVGGFSQGGMLTYRLATHHPEVVGFAIPMAGWLPEVLWPTEAEAKGAAPMLAFHGEADTVVPFAATRDMIEAFRRRGAKIELVSEPRVRHTITAAMHQAVLAALETEVIARFAAAGRLEDREEGEVRTATRARRPRDAGAPSAPRDAAQ